MKGNYMANNTTISKEPDIHDNHKEEMDEGRYKVEAKTGARTMGRKDYSSILLDQNIKDKLEGIEAKALEGARVIWPGFKAQYKGYIGSDNLFMKAGSLQPDYSKIPPDLRAYNALDDHIKHTYTIEEKAELKKRELIYMQVPKKQRRAYALRSIAEDRQKSMVKTPSFDKSHNSVFALNGINGNHTIQDIIRWIKLTNPAAKDLLYQLHAIYQVDPKHTISGEKVLQLIKGSNSDISKFWKVIKKEGYIIDTTNKSEKKPVTETTTSFPIAQFTPNNFNEVNYISKTLLDTNMYQTTENPKKGEMPSYLFDSTIFQNRELIKFLKAEKINISAGSKEMHDNLRQKYVKEMQHLQLLSTKEGVKHHIANNINLDELVAIVKRQNSFFNQHLRQQKQHKRH